MRRFLILVSLACASVGAYAQGLGDLDLSGVDPQLVRQGLQLLQTMTPAERTAAIEAAKEALGSMDLKGLKVDSAGLKKGLDMVRDAVRISANVKAREEKHAAELAAQGLAEVPASAAVRYTIDTHGLGDLLFDGWGELYIDRRFLTDDELKRVKEIESFMWRHVLVPLRGAKAQPARARAGGAGLPVFRGFEDARYQAHDALIARMVADFNAHKAAWCGGTAAQAAKIADLTPALVKAQMIEETGGNSPRSRAAWAKDPLQVNVPGDWGPEKEALGLVKPARRNEGAAEQNVRAAIMYLSRKGFGPSGKPASERPKGFFDGWPTALVRYNGRRDRTDTDRYYGDEYADRILARAANPDRFVPIEIRLKANR